MYRFSLSLLVACLMVVPALGQPAEWQDDFTTAATWDFASLLGPCYGGLPTKYTMLDAIGADIFGARLVSGGGMAKLSSQAFDIVAGRFDMAIAGWLGLGIGCPGEPTPLTSSASFTSPDLCIYYGAQWGSYNLGFSGGNPISDAFGPDSQPGVAGVDDDCDGRTDTQGLPGVDDDGDGTIDEDGEDLFGAIESPAYAGANAYYPPGVPPDGGSAGCANAPSDGAPGIAGVDDDGDGVTDNLDEMGMGNDSDDLGGRLFQSTIMRLNLNTSSAVWANIDPGSGGGNLFSIRQIFNLAETGVEASNEMVGGFWQPGTSYNAAFCATGTCYGAVLWIDADMTNPKETVGPVIITAAFPHNTVADHAVAFLGQSGDNATVRDIQWKGNKNFGSTLWVVSGATSLADFTGGIFGYPSPSPDLDNDRDVDAGDFLTFSNCYNGSLVPPTGICANLDADFDGDSDVDANDFLTFSNCYNGSITKPKPICFPHSNGAFAPAPGAGLTACP